MWPKTKAVLGWIWAPPFMRSNWMLRWGWRVGIFVVLLILAVPLIIVPLGESIACGKIEGAVSDSMNAQLEIDALHYAPPLGAVLDGIRLIGNGPDGQPMTLVDLPEASVTLAGVPGSSVEISSVALNGLTLHAVRLPSGTLWVPQMADLLKPSPNPPAPASAQSSSLTVHVQQVSVKDAKLLVREGDSTFDPGKDAADLAIDVGPVDVANNVLTVSSLHLATQSNEAIAGVRGNLSLDGSATVPLDDPKSLKSDINLNANVAALTDGINNTLDVKMNFHTADQKGSVTLNQFAVKQGGAGGASFVVKNQPEISLDLTNNKWTAAPLSARMEPGNDPSQLPPSVKRIMDQLGLKNGGFSLAAQGSGVLPTKPVQGISDCLALIDPSSAMVIVPDRVTLQPADWPHQIVVDSQNSRAIYVDRDGVEVNNLHADYGYDLDRYTIQSMRISLVDLLAGNIRVQNFQSQVKLDSFAPPLPVKFHYVFGDLPPDGTITLAADDLMFQSSHMSGDFRIGIKDGLIKLDSINADLPTANQQLAAQCALKIVSLNLRELREIAHYPDPQGKIAGVVSGDIQVKFRPLKTGEPAINAIVARGTISVDDGDFFDIPMFGAIADNTGVPVDQAGRIGQAAAIFTIENGVMHFNNLAVNSPALGIAGSGNINLTDNTLDLTLVAQVLGDWKSKAGGIPGLSNALGFVQSKLNQFSANYLYNFHVSGTFANPILDPRVLPALNGGQTNLFGAMQNLGSKGGDLLNKLKGQQDNQGEQNTQPQN